MPRPRFWYAILKNQTDWRDSRVVKIKARTRHRAYSIASQEEGWNEVVGAVLTRDEMLKENPEWVRLLANVEPLEESDA